MHTTEPMYLRVKRYINGQPVCRKQVAINMGITESQLSLLLSGKRRLTVDEYVRLCNAISVSPMFFFDAPH